MALGSRTRRSNQIDGRRCCKCKKVAKDLIDGEYLCRVHSPTREGFINMQKKKKEEKKKEAKKDKKKEAKKPWSNEVWKKKLWSKKQ